MWAVDPIGHSLENAGGVETVGEIDVIILVLVKFALPSLCETINSLRSMSILGQYSQSHTCTQVNMRYCLL